MTEASVLHPYTREEIWTNWMNKDFLFWVNRTNRNKFFLENNAERMKGQYLGACLDYTRWGAMNACFWVDEEKHGSGIKNLINLIEKWMALNKDNLIWSDKIVDKKTELPRIDYKNCPRNKEHKEIIKEDGGRIRCAHIEDRNLLHNFSYSREGHENYDSLAMMNRKIGGKTGAKEKDICYAMISESKNNVMPLEMIIGRLNIESLSKINYCKDIGDCQEINEENISFFGPSDTGLCVGHRKPNPIVGFPFDGWTLAEYVQKWYEQVPDGKAPVYMNKGQIDSFKMFPDFRVMSSND